MHAGLYRCAQAYTRMHTCTHNTQHTHTHTHTHMQHTHTHTHTCNTHTHATHTYTHTHTHTHTHATHTHTHIQHTHTHTHTHTHATHTHTHTSNTHTHTHTWHTHTHTLQRHTLLVMDWYRSVCRGKEMGFHFWLKRREWRQMPDRERKGVPENRSNVLKGSLPQGPSAHPRNTEDVSIHGWEMRARRRVVSVINKQSSREKLTTVLVGC